MIRWLVRDVPKHVKHLEASIDGVFALVEDRSDGKMCLPL